MRAAAIGVLAAVVAAAGCSSSETSEAERRRLNEVRNHDVFEIDVADGRPQSIVATSGRAGDREVSTRASREWTLDGADDAVLVDFVKGAVERGVEVTRLSCIDAQDTVSGLLDFSDGPALVTIALRNDPPALSILVTLGHSGARPQPTPVVVDGACPDALREAAGAK